MSALLETPIDYTGLPFCFAPYENLAPVVPQGEINRDRLADWNHMFPKYEIHTSNSPVLQEDLGRLALQNARVQWVDYSQHHDKYNHWFKGPKQPQTSEDLFKTLVMATAGYIPAKAIDLSGDDPKIVELTNSQRKFLWMSGQVRQYDESSVRSYLFDYALSQDVDHIHERSLDEFLHTFNLEKKIHLGHCIAAKIVERAVEPIEYIYSTAQRSELLKPGLPKHPRDYVKHRMIPSPHRFGRVMNILSMRLGAYNRENNLVTSY